MFFEEMFGLNNTPTDNKIDPSTKQLVNTVCKKVETAKNKLDKSKKEYKKIVRKTFPKFPRLQKEIELKDGVVFPESHIKPNKL